MRSRPNRRPFLLISIALGAMLLFGCQWSHRNAPEEQIAITSIDQLDWLAGHWVSESEAGSLVNEELWLAPAGGLMLGVNRTLEGGRAVFYEFVMIREMNGHIAYLAMPGGQSPPTVFPLVESSAGMTAIFENPAHDFPQRIVYRRDGDQLTATLTGGSGEEEVEPRLEQWNWRRAAH